MSIDDSEDYVCVASYIITNYNLYQKNLDDHSA